MSSAGDRADVYKSIRVAVRQSEGTDGEKSHLGAVGAILCRIHLSGIEARSASHAQAE